MNTENTLCFVVDIQERLLPVLHGADEMTACCRILLQGMRALNIPLLATEQYPKGLGRTIPAVQLLLDGAPVFEKTRFSACLPQVETVLREKRIKNVILAGAETHICMLQTVLDLRSRGFGVYVPYDCTTSRLSSNKENGLQQMREAGVVVSNTESLLFMLLGDAAHPAFKTVSQLIR